MQKNIVKFGVGVVGIAALGAAIFYGVNWYQYRNSPEYAQKLEYQKLLEAYRNDAYGGVTPEETLQLFIDALKAGDTELAAKYFILEEQEEMSNYFGGLKNQDGLGLAITDVERLRLTKKDEDRAFFTASNKEGIVELQVIVGRAPNGKWKILEL